MFSYESIKQRLIPKFRFETRPVSKQLKGEAFEFILVNEPALKNRQADIDTFAEYFQRGETKIRKFLDLTRF